MDSSGDAQLEKWFPNLKPGEYEVRSPTAVRYNCIAWAAGHDDQWWEPSSGDNDYFWPDDPSVPNTDTIAAAIAVFRWIGYEDCAITNISPEPGYEKVAIYGGDEAFTHAAKLTDEGWSSKIGPFQDIVHKTLDSLAGGGDSFGKVVAIMRRKLPPPPMSEQSPEN